MISPVVLCKSSFLQLFQGDRHTLPEQMGHVLPLVCPGLAPGGLLPVGSSPGHLQREAYQVLRSPQLASFSVEEQLVHIEALFAVPHRVNYFSPKQTLFIYNKLQSALRAEEKRKMLN